MKGFQLAIANDGMGWKVHCRITNGMEIWDAKDDAETLDHAAGLGIAQMQAWIENLKGLPPAGLKFGEPK